MSKKVARCEDDDMATTRLRRLEVIEGLLDFDLPTLIKFADEIADERQSLTRQVQRSARMRTSDRTSTEGTL